MDGWRRFFVAALLMLPCNFSQPQFAMAQTTGASSAAEAGQVAQGEGQPAVPTPQSVFMKAAAEAQDRLETAISAGKLEDAEAAAEAIASALDALQSATSVARFRSQAEALRIQAERLKGDVPDDLVKELDSLSAELDRLRGQGSIAFLKKEADRLKALYDSTTPVDDKAPETHKALIKAVIDRLRQISPDVAAASLGEVVTSVATMVPGHYEPPWADAKFATAIGAATTKLDTEYKAHLWVRYFTDRANGISGGLLLAANAKDDDKQKAEYARKQLVAEPDAMAAAAKLKTAVEALAGGYRPAIHIMAAGFGDIHASEGSSRLCDATLGLRTACQRKTVCKLPDNYETTLCGYDPAPAAEDSIKAVTVFYACFTGGDPVWDELAQRPGRDPVDGTALTKGHPAVSSAVMRGTVNELRCPSEPASAGGSGQ
jgi:hypothetical protein